MGAVKGMLAGMGILEAAKLFQEFGEKVFEAGEKIVEFVHHGIEAVTATTLMAEKIGASVQGFGELSYAAKLSGVDMESLGNAIGKLQQNIGDSLIAVTPATAAFQRLGLTAEQLANMDAVDAFKAIAEGISKLPGRALQASVAVDIFGKSGKELLNVLSEGKEGIDKWAKEAVNLGIAFNGVDAAKVHEAHQALIRVGAVVEGIANLMAIELSPYITLATEAFLHWANTGVSMSLMVKAALLTVVSTFLDLTQAAQDFIYGPFASLAKMAGMDFAGDLKNSFANLVMQVELANIHLGEAKEHVESLIEPQDKLADKVQTTIDQIAAQKDALEFGADGMTLYKLMLDGATQEQLDFVASLQDSIKAMQDQKGIDTISQGLQKQIDLYGKTRTEIELLKAAELGASEEELNAIRALGDKLDALDRNKQAMEDQQKYMDGLKQKAEQFYDATRTPLEKYQSEIEQLNELLDKGLISDDTFKRASDSAREKLDGDKKGDHEKKFAGAVELGSAEGRSAILNNRLGRQNKDKTPLETLAEMKKQTPLLAKIADAKPDIFIIAP